MSNTYIIKIRRKLARASKDELRIWFENINKLQKQGFSRTEARFMADRLDIRNSAYNRLSEKEKQRVNIHYSRNPSWYNKMTFHSPLRRKIRDKLKVQTLNGDEDLQLDFKNKPMDYYW
jgi:hypothetical protein